MDNSQGSTGAEPPRGTSAGARGATPEERRPASDFDDDCEDEYPELEMEIGLPLRGENYVTGEPLVTVDYFAFAAQRRSAVAERLLGLDHALADEGAGPPRILLFEGPRADGNFDVLDLIAILTVREADLRVETARAELVDAVRGAVESALGDDVRHLRRRSENPVEEFLER